MDTKEQLVKMNKKFFRLTFRFRENLVRIHVYLNKSCPNMFKLRFIEKKKKEKKKILSIPINHWNRD